MEIATKQPRIEIACKISTGSMWAELPSHTQACLPGWVQVNAVSGYFLPEANHRKASLCYAVAIISTYFSGKLKLPQQNKKAHFIIDFFDRK